MEAIKLDSTFCYEIEYIEKECFVHPWSKKSILESFKRNNYSFFGVICNDKLVAYGGVSIIANEAYITNIAVLKDYRNKGFGLVVVKSIVNECINKKSEFVTLEVRENNISAINLYSKCEFKKVGVRKNFYTDPIENAIIMTRKFGDNI